MSARTPFRLNRSGALLALVSAAFAGEAGAAAGRAEFTIGGVTVARNGVERALTRGAELDNGDVIRTNDGRAQIRFTDGAYVSLQPNTEFGIRDYRFENKTDGSERGFFGLVKGAMRTVTGLIGRVNRDRYQIATPTATVGIRGTGGVIQVQQDGSTLVIGTSGIWSLTNPAGSIDVPAGVSGLSPSDPNQPPSETTQPPTADPAPLPPQEPVYVQAEDRTPTGDPLVLAPAAVLTTGPGYSTVIATDIVQQIVDGGEGNVFATFNSLGQLTSAEVTDIRSPSLFTLQPGGTHADFGTDGILAWGRWTGPVTSNFFEGTRQYGPNEGLHYVVGIPTAVMPTSGTATYSLIGATRPTYLDASTVPGAFSGSLTVDFGEGSVGIAARVTMPDQTYTLGGSAFIDAGAHFFGATGLGLTATGCVSTCNALVRGFFAGTNAARAGIGYHIRDGIGEKDVVGTAAFRRN